MRSSQITRVLAIAFIVYAVLVVVVVMWAFRWASDSGHSLDEATKVAAVWISVLTAGMAAFATLCVAFVQRENNEILTALQGASARQLEERKVQITAEQKAYDELCGAASYYYYAIKQIESGQFEQTQTKTAEKGMVAACRHLVAISEEDTKAWMQVWQLSRYMAHEVAPKDAAERKMLYGTHIKRLDDHYQSFFAAARKHHLARTSNN